MTGFEPALLAWKAVVLPLTLHPLEPVQGIQPCCLEYETRVFEQKHRRRADDGIRTHDRFHTREGLCH